MNFCVADTQPLVRHCPSCMLWAGPWVLEPGRLGKVRPRHREVTTTEQTACALVMGAWEKHHGRD